MPRPTLYPEPITPQSVTGIIVQVTTQSRVLTAEVARQGIVVRKLGCPILTANKLSTNVPIEAFHLLLPEAKPLQNMEKLMEGEQFALYASDEVANEFALFPEGQPSALFVPSCCGFKDPLEVIIAAACNIWNSQAPAETQIPEEEWPLIAEKILNRLIGAV
ncbi:MAG TPA: hypothetical protein VEC13_02855 [Candidatus Paceibacterota bacterium]|nr:hypothetical protein [Candidatus Paceibacterota bacterium]